MMGKLGFDIVVHELSEKDLQFSKAAVKEYNNVKDIIWYGDLYRLVDPRKNSTASLMYVDEKKERAVVFNYLVNNRYDEGSVFPVIFQGLDPNKKYTVKEINVYEGTKSPISEQEVYSGDFLMKGGFNPQVRKGRESVVLKVEVVK
jgi:alpha-galactosidase